MSNHIKSDFHLFSSADGKISVDVRFDGETVWLSLEQMANLFWGCRRLAVMIYCKNEDNTL